MESLSDCRTYCRTVGSELNMVCGVWWWWWCGSGGLGVGVMLAILLARRDPAEPKGVGSGEERVVIRIQLIVVYRVRQCVRHGARTLEGSVAKAR